MQGQEKEEKENKERKQQKEGGAPALTKKGPILQNDPALTK